MSSVTEQLIACADASAIISTLKSFLTESADIQDRQASINEIMTFLMASKERKVLIRTLISDYSETNVEHDVQLELLETLLRSMMQESIKNNHTNLEILLSFFQLAVARLSAIGSGNRWIKWGECVLTVVYQNAKFLQNLIHISDKVEKNQWIAFVIRLATLLLQLRHTLDGHDDANPEFKTLTFVWKNLAKLATTAGPILSQMYIAENDTDNLNNHDEDQASSRHFHVQQAMAAAATSVERSVRQLLDMMDTPNTTECVLLDKFQFLKLYWRAFQRLFIVFGNFVKDELKNCVLLCVNVTASFVYFQWHGHFPSPAKQELRELVDQTLAFCEKLADKQVVNAHLQNKIHTFLWYSSEDMKCAVSQRQGSLDSTRNDVENAIQWGHLLVLTTFAGASVPNSFHSNATNPVKTNDLIRSVEISHLFARYRDCALLDNIASSNEVVQVFTDLILQYFEHFEQIKDLQLVLWQQTMYPDWMQRTVCWEVWRELLCFCWKEALAASMLQLVLDIISCDENDSIIVLASGVEDELFQLLCYVYRDLPVVLKDMCIHQVTRIINVISTEGPSHPFSLCVASQLQLLEHLVAVEFLKNYNGLLKEEWIAQYLPLCLECCGTVLELLSTETLTFSTPWENWLGIARVLDVSLLVLRGVFDNTELGHENAMELSNIIVHLSIEAIAQLAKHSKQMTQSHAIVNNVQVDRTVSSKRLNHNLQLERASVRSFTRAIETALYFLSKLGSILKTNTNHQCVRVLQDLLLIVDSARNLQHVGRGSELLIIVARFVESALFDMQIARNDMPVVWQLLRLLFQKLFTAAGKTESSLLLSVCLDALYEVVAHSNIVEHSEARLCDVVPKELKLLFATRVSMRKRSPEDFATALKRAIRSMPKTTFQTEQRSFHDTLRKQFPDDTTELYSDRGRSSQIDTVTTTKRLNENQCNSLSAKRQKLIHVATLCQEIQSFLSTLHEENAANVLLSDKELDDATTMLRSLLAKKHGTVNK
ncbi:hypothetical protein CCR75_001160 [Bremia lactucae]|uniref:Uncharacterized protein n=1 Tax=Bremia lactucae TaxID=4779 RepID=A0A976IGP1_BRELC|nr:hypothetical protein CCR75_001160 [Bremia lactucae]